MANAKKKCKFCLEYFPVADGLKYPFGFFCSLEHVTQHAKQKGEEARKNQEAAVKRSRVHYAKVERKRERDRKMEVKPLSYWMKRAQAAVNAWIRASKGGQCISCGRYHDGQMHAGHYRSTAAAPEIRFEPDNIWPQCQPCNVHLSANIIRYRPALIAKIGLERVEWLEGQHEPKRYRREDYQAIEAEYKAKLKELKGVNNG